MTESQGDFEGRLARKIAEARGLFEAGAACSQSVLAVFSGELGLSREAALRLASGFGAGVGRLREVCGAFSAVVMVAGMLYGNDDPGDKARKDGTYQVIQELARRFKEESGSLICRELLGLEPGQTDVPVSEARTKAYYQRRPCEDLVELGVRVMYGYMEERCGGRAAKG